MFCFLDTRILLEDSGIVNWFLQTVTTLRKGNSSIRKVTRMQGMNQNKNPGQGRDIVPRFHPHGQSQKRQA